MGGSNLARFTAGVGDEGMLYTCLQTLEAGPVHMPQMDRVEQVQGTSPVEGDNPAPEAWHAVPKAHSPEVPYDGLDAEH